jgi:hypothetical protein
MSLCDALALLVLACLFSSVSAAGEDAPPDFSLTPGMRVRVFAPDISSRKAVGTINRVDDKSVTTDVPSRSEPVSVLREKIARLDVSTGRRSRLVDAAIGAGIGAAGSALACSASETKHSYVVSNTAVTAGCAVVGACLAQGLGRQFHQANTGTKCRRTAMGSVSRLASITGSIWPSRGDFERVGPALARSNERFNQTRLCNQEGGRP